MILAGRPAKILLIDTNVYFSKRLSDALKREGFEVNCSTQPAFALTTLEYDCPSAIVCSTNMREMGALDIARMIRADSKNSTLPIVALGDGSQRALMEAFQAGCDDYIDRSRPPAVIATHIRNIIVSKAEGFQPTQMLQQSDTSLSGSLSHHDLPGVMQMLGHAHQTGALNINSGDTDAVLFFDAGTITHAECGALFGDEAVIHILKNCFQNNSGGYKFLYGSASTQRTVLRSATDLMLDAMREVDESTRAPEETPVSSLAPAEQPVSATEQDGFASSLPGADAISGAAADASSNVNEEPTAEADQQFSYGLLDEQPAAEPVANESAVNAEEELPQLASEETLLEIAPAAEPSSHAYNDDISAIANQLDHYVSANSGESSAPEYQYSPSTEFDSAPSAEFNLPASVNEQPHSSSDQDHGALPETEPAELAISPESECVAATQANDSPLLAYHDESPAVANPFENIAEEFSNGFSVAPETGKTTDVATEQVFELNADSEADESVDSPAAAEHVPTHQDDFSAITSVLDRYASTHADDSSAAMPASHEAAMTTEEDLSASTQEVENFAGTPAANDSELASPVDLSAIAHQVIRLAAPSNEPSAATPTCDEFAVQPSDQHSTEANALNDITDSQEVDESATASNVKNSEHSAADDPSVVSRPEEVL